MNKMKDLAQDLLKIKAVFLSPNKPFTWASGIKSPIYCDNRLTLSYPEIREKIASGMASIINEKFSDVDLIMGTATAGIPHATLVAHLLKKPCGYVRGKAKDHGRTNQIEGRFEKGQKVVLIEDLISTGGSSLEAVEALRENGLEVLAVISIFTYGMKKAIDNFNSHNCKAISLVKFDELLEEAKNENYINANDIAKITKFMANPSDESWLNS